MIFQTNWSEIALFKDFSKSYKSHIEAAAFSAVNNEHNTMQLSKICLILIRFGIKA